MGLTHQVSPQACKNNTRWARTVNLRTRSGSTLRRLARRPCDLARGPCELAHGA